MKWGPLATWLPLLFALCLVVGLHWIWMRMERTDDLARVVISQLLIWTWAVLLFQAFIALIKDDEEFGQLSAAIVAPHAVVSPTSYALTPVDGVVRQ